MKNQGFRFLKKGWHFLRKDKRMQFPPYVKVGEGATYTCDGELKLCRNGLHASERILDALKYAPGPIVCRVELDGEIVHSDDKAVARSRKVLWMVDATNILHEFACRCAEDALALVKNPDPRSVAAIKAKRDWLGGKITDKELAAARDAARDVVWAAARNTAWTAARGAARGAARDVAHVARAAALDAARKAAWGAARTAVWDAAWATAWDAAWAADWAAVNWAAAWTAARNKQNRRLTQMVVRARKAAKDLQTR